jgi:UDP-N-acetylmuramate dehydrogenase
MSISIQENVPLKDHTTFKMGGLAQYFTEVKEEQDVPELFAFAKSKGLEVMPLGKGSNFVFSDDGIIHKVVAKIDIKGREMLDENEQYAMVKFYGGNLWDDDVAWAVEHSLSGIEAMSAIPGTTGATPVQNVGAYGQEITDTLIELEAYDLQKEALVKLSNKDCQFAYRKSIFNSTERGRYFITSITLKLLKKTPTIPNYPGVKEYFAEKGIDMEKIALKNIREAITEIRNSKLPDPEVNPNLGSFFKNAIITKAKADELKEKYADAKLFPQADGSMKVSSGWLIDKAGLKGKAFGNFAVYDKNALVLTHNGQGSFQELLRVRDEIIKIVKEKFDITLEHEPNFIER